MSIENEYMPGDIILHNGLVWTCSLCHRTNFEKYDIEHRENCPFSRPGVVGVKILKLGPWVEYGKEFMHIGLSAYDEVLMENGSVYVVGDINTEGSKCDCCADAYDIVVKYRKVGK